MGQWWFLLSLGGWPTFSQGNCVQVLQKVSTGFHVSGQCEDICQQSCSVGVVEVTDGLVEARQASLHWRVLLKKKGFMFGLRSINLLVNYFNVIKDCWRFLTEMVCLFVCLFKAVCICLRFVKSTFVYEKETSSFFSNISRLIKVHFVGFRFEVRLQFETNWTSHFSSSLFFLLSLYVQSRRGKLCPEWSQKL